MPQFPFIPSTLNNPKILNTNIYISEKIVTIGNAMELHVLDSMKEINDANNQEHLKLLSKSIRTMDNKVTNYMIENIPKTQKINLSTYIIVFMACITIMTTIISYVETANLFEDAVRQIRMDDNIHQQNTVYRLEILEHIIKAKLEPNNDKIKP